MNIYQNVIDSVAATGGDITESGGFINIAGSSPLSIPKGRIMGAKRVLAGERAQVFTITAPATVSNSVTYTVTVSGKSPVTGILKSFYSTYTTAVSGNTQAGLAASLAAGFVASPDFPFTVAYTPAATSFTITAKSGTPVISIAVSPNVGSNLLTVANTTTALSTAITATKNATNTGLAGTGAFPGGVNVFNGTLVTLVDPSSTAPGGLSYLGVITSNADADNATALPIISASTTSPADTLYTVDNTGATLENVYAYASLPGVTLSPTNKYVIYEIDAVAPSYAGNGARPDAIDSKYIIYVNGGDPDVWTATTGFDAALATRLGFAF